MKLKPFSRSRNRKTIFPIGIVTAIDVGRGQLVVKTDSGPKIEVLLDERTALRRVERGAKSLTNARPIQASDIRVGDRVLVRGYPVISRTTFAARSVFVRTFGPDRETRGSPTVPR